ncbi:transposase [Bradyrhizobium sp. USDA 4509]
MSIVILGIDLGKNSCSVVRLDEHGTIVVRRRMRRDGVIAFAAKLAPCMMAMEACCDAHHMGRSLVALGHEVRLMSPEYVRPYVKAQKNDDRDAEAIAEAATRPTMRFVELKSEEQLDVQTLHRVGDCLVGERTSLTNQIRSLLLGGVDSKDSLLGANQIQGCFWGGRLGCDGPFGIERRGVGADGAVDHRAARSEGLDRARQPNVR